MSQCTVLCLCSSCKSLYDGCTNTRALST